MVLVLQDRKGDWIQTYSGIAFYPFDPKEEEILIEDIAHALSMLCRFGGHCEQFYSVAEHCCHVSDLADSFHKLEGLLHDAAEAYIVDVPRPIKQALDSYKYVENLITNVIESKYLLDKNHHYIKQIDNIMLMTEASQNMKSPPKAWVETANINKLELRYWSPKEAEYQFLERFYRLWKQ